MLPCMVLDINLGHDFLDLIPKAKSKKRENKYMGSYPIKMLYTANKTINNKIKRQPTKWEKAVPNHRHDVG